MEDIIIFDFSRLERIRQERSELLIELEKELDKLGIQKLIRRE